MRLQAVDIGQHEIHFPAATRKIVDAPFGLEQAEEDFERVGGRRVAAIDRLEL